MTFTEILKQFDIPFRQVGESPHVTHGWIGIICPFCGEGTNKFGLGYSLAGGNLTCWKCGPHKVLETLHLLTGESVGKLWELIKDDYRETQAKREPVKGTLKYPQGVTEMTSSHHAYLKRRGFDPEIIHRLWNVHGIGLVKRLPWRLFIPIANAQGKVVSWTTRSLSDLATSRYVTAKASEEAVSAKTLLYGEMYARHAVIVVEGPLDAWRIGPGAVATLGVSYSKEQVNRMAKYPVRVVCFDNEPEAQRRASKLCSALAVFPGRTVKVILDAKDPGSAGQAEVNRLRRLFLE